MPTDELAKSRHRVGRVSRDVFHHLDLDGQASVHSLCL